MDGKYEGKCWNDGSIFIKEDEFSLVEDIFKETNSEYDHYSFIEYNENQIKLVIQKLNNRFIELENDNFYITGSVFKERFYTRVNGLIAENTVYNNISPVANSSGIYCDGCVFNIIFKGIRFCS